MSDRLEPPSSQAESTLLTPGDRISNFPAPPSEAGDHAERDQTLPCMPMADAEARFAEWFTEVNKYLIQGVFATTTAADSDALSKHKTGQKAKREIKRARQTKRADKTTSKQAKGKPANLNHPGQPPGATTTGKPSGRITESTRTCTRTRSFYARDAKRANDFHGNTVARNRRAHNTALAVSKCDEL